MKRYLFFFMLAALACGCNDSEGDSPAGTGSETQQPVSADEILPRRLVSADVTLSGESPSSETYAYDGQGRLTSITCFGDGYSDTYTYTYTYTDNTIVVGYDNSDEITYRLKNGRAVTARYKYIEGDWSEMSFNYDAVGYLASFSSTGAEGFEYDCAVTYAANGISFKAQGDEWNDTLFIEFDRMRLNNQNLDFYGESRWELANMLGEYCQFYLFGVGGQRLRYLPATTTVVLHEKEDGQWYTDKSVSRYVYHMDGDYLSEVEIYNEGEGESKEPTRIVFHYE